MTGALEYWQAQELGAKDQKLVQDILEHDCHVLLVNGGKAPNWTFSVGLFERFSHPELAVFGLPGEVAHFLINELTARIRAGDRLVPGDRIEGLLEGGYVCCVKKCQRRWYEALFGYAEWFYRGQEFPALQVIWPDKSGCYPWESEFNPAWANIQPLLDQDDVETARMAKFIEPQAGGCCCEVKEDDWKFADDPHVQSITQRHIAKEKAPILLVAREETDRVWQFLDGSEDPQDVVAACMHHLIELDPSLNELSDLPVGWQAWRRNSTDPWQRGPIPEEE